MNKLDNFVHTIHNALPQDQVVLISTTLLCMIMNLIGRMIDNYLMIAVSTPAPCVIFLSVSRLSLQHKEHSDGDKLRVNMVAIGLFLSCIGDVVLCLRISGYETIIFVMGIIIFGVVQALYIYAWSFASGQKESVHYKRAVPFLLYFIVFKVTGTGCQIDPLTVLMDAYMVLILTTAWRCAARIDLSSQASFYQLLAFVGVLLFLACDSMIGYQALNAKYVECLTIVNMSLYWVGQLLIALSCNECVTLQDVVSYVTSTKERYVKAQGQADY
ncbi:hypothetical protein AKO1_014792 [Acrasis kona]|uniref:Uncharacterized protein n=1 Tax=Acrasis kona TaxID=1008807 RepID=A0AAW2Z3K3_9EUKA